jgi:hypothetical protein
VGDIKGYVCSLKGNDREGRYAYVGLYEPPPFGCPLRKKTFVSMVRHLQNLPMSRRIPAIANLVQGMGEDLISAVGDKVVGGDIKIHLK